MTNDPSTVDFYYDPISPYAYLAFHALPNALEGVSVQVRYRPVLFGALLKAGGHKGPAEIAGKREWTYRQVLWQAREMDLPMAMPAAHPFNPLALSRSALAASDGSGFTNRWVTQMVLDHVWQGGQDPLEADRLAGLQTVLQAHRQEAYPGSSELSADEVKQLLVDNTEHAMARGVFGVPTCEWRGELFWGLDALPMLRQAIAGDEWFHSAAWRDAASIPVGIARKV
ncbi:MAG: 2-hydroxychromene-2-carboxylate isomerase [Pseudomonadota bacterium]